MPNFFSRCRLGALLAGALLALPLADAGAQQRARPTAAAVRRGTPRAVTIRAVAARPVGGRAVAARRKAPVARPVVAAARTAAIPVPVAPPAPRSIVIAPIGSAMRIAVPIRGDGEFRADGLQSGRYRLVLASVPVDRQTQSARLGAPDSLTSAAALRAVPGPRAERIVSVGRLTRSLALDADTMQVQVGMDGHLAGVVKAK